MRYLELIERSTGRSAILKPMDVQLGDVPNTCANAGSLRNDLGIRDFLPAEEEIDPFLKCFRG